MALSREEAENLARDYCIFPAYTDYLFGVDARPEALEERGLHPMLPQATTYQATGLSTEKSTALSFKSPPPLIASELAPPPPNSCSGVRERLLLTNEILRDEYNFINPKWREKINLFVIKMWRGEGDRSVSDECRAERMKALLKITRSVEELTSVYKKQVYKKQTAEARVKEIFPEMTHHLSTVRRRGASEDEKRVAAEWIGRTKSKLSPEEVTCMIEKLREWIEMEINGEIPGFSNIAPDQREWVKQGNSDEDNMRGLSAMLSRIQQTVGPDRSSNPPVPNTNATLGTPEYHLPQGTRNTRHDMAPLGCTTGHDLHQETGNAIPNAFTGGIPGYQLQQGTGYPIPSPSIGRVPGHQLQQGTGNTTGYNYQQGMMNVMPTASNAGHQVQPRMGDTMPTATQREEVDMTGWPSPIRHLCRPRDDDPKAPWFQS